MLIDLGHGVLRSIGGNIRRGRCRSGARSSSQGSLSDSKTGARLAPLSPAAARVLAELPRIEGNPWVIPGMKPGYHPADLNHDWDRVRERADLEGVRIHDLRHSCASQPYSLAA